MACSIACLNDGICSSNDTCICSPCFTGNKCEISTNVIKFSLTYAMFWDIKNVNPDVSFNSPKFSYTLVIAIMLVMAFINNLVCLQTFLKHDIRTSNCGVLQILYCITGLITIIGMQFRMLTMLVFDSLTQSYSYRIFACNIIPVIVILMGNICMWLSTALIIEFFLLEYFNLIINRPRRYSVISSIIIFILTTASHVHESFGRRPIPNPTQPELYACTFVYPLPVDIIDKVLRVCHVIIPLGVHFIVTICMIISITRRTLLVRDRNDFFPVFIKQALNRKHFFVPPLFIIVTNLPHLILHLKDECEDARDIKLLRIHVTFNILVYLPATMTFFIYIYPSMSYMNQFNTSLIGRWLQRTFCPNRKRTPDSNTVKIKAVSHETILPMISPLESRR